MDNRRQTCMDIVVKSSPESQSCGRARVDGTEQHQRCECRRAELHLLSSRPSWNRLLLLQQRGIEREIRGVHYSTDGYHQLIPVAKKIMHRLFGSIQAYRSA